MVFLAFCVLAGSALAEVVYTQTFDGGTGGFTVNGTQCWQWGIVSSGPGMAHSPDKAWATGLAGNYPNSQDSYLTSPVLDLSEYAGSFLMLSWWQMLHTENVWDTARVQVSKNGGAGWTTMYGEVSGTVDGQWTRHTVLLDDGAATSAFRVRFVFHSDETNTAPGWYLDDVSIAATPRSETQLTFEDFEADDGGYEPTGSWEWGTPSSGPGAAYSGTSVWATSLSGDYAPLETAMLVSAPLDTSANPGEPEAALRISWKQWLVTESYDSAWVDVSADDGASWNRIYGLVSGAVSPTWSSCDVLLAPEYAVSNLRLRFALTADSFFEFEGFYVDDVEVSRTSLAAPAPDSFSISGIEDQTLPLTYAAFGAESNEDLLVVRLESVPSNGSLQLYGRTLQSGSEIDVWALPAIEFVPAPDVSGSDYFEWTGGNGLFYAGSPSATSLELEPVNDPPANITLTPQSVAENQPVGTVVGTLAAEDPDTGESFVFSLVPGAEGPDNDLFTIEGAILRTAVSLDFEDAPERQVLVEVRDVGNLTHRQSFVITVTDEPEQPAVETGSLGPVSPTEATVTGNYVAGEGCSVLSRGVCWAVVSEFALESADGHVVVPGATGSFDAVLSGLTPGTTYYARAYATCAFGEGYGAALEFVTPRQPQSIAFSPLAEKTFGDAPFAVSATATSGLPVSFTSSDGTVATVAEDGRGWTVTIHGAGTCTITASQAGDANWEAAAPVGQTLVVQRAVPVVTWPDPAPIVYGTALSSTQLNATADTDGEFTYAPDSGTVLAAGTHTLSADFAPAEPANWEPVAGTTVTLEVTRAPQSIAFGPLAEKTFGDAPFAVSATATSGLPVSFSSSDGTVATVAGDGRGWTVTIHGAGTCTITASQAGDANWEAAAPVGQTLVVHRAVPVVTWPDPAPVVYGTALSGAQLNATADTDGEFTYDPDLGAVLPAGTHTLSADFAPAEPANWEPVAGTTVTLEVTRAPQSIAFSPLAEKTFGDAPFAVSATATSGLPVSFSSSDDSVATVVEEGRGWTVTIHGAGTCTITASQAGDADWEAAAPVGQTLVVQRAVPVVTWPDPAPIVYGTALSGAQLNAAADTDGEFTYDPDLGAVLAAGTHTLSADFAPAEPANWEPVAGTTVTLEVTRAPQSIAFSPIAEKTFGDAPFAVSATATSGLPVSFSSSDGTVATVAGDGRGWTVTIHGAGTCTITASQAGDADWEAAAPVGQTLVVHRAVPVVTWPDPAPVVYGTALSSTQLNATADTDGEFSYDPDLGAVLPAGTHTLSADFAPAEPANWEPVAGTTVTLEVTRAPQSIAFSPLAEKAFGDAPFAVTATATSGLPVSFSSSDGTVATVAGDGRGWTVTIHGAGTCTITASQAGDANWEAAAPVGQTLVVHRAVPVVTWPDPAPVVYGTALSSTQLNATADTDGEFSYDPDLGAVLPAGTHTLSADFAPAEPANWEPVAGTTVTLEVTRAPQSIAFGPLAEKTFGDAPFAVSATATSGLPVSFSSSDGTVATVAGDGRGWTVTIHGAGTCTITASQAGDANWEAAPPVGQALVVHRAVPVVTWPDPAPVVYGTALSATQLNAAADTDGEFSYDPDLGAVLPAGTHTLSADFAPAEPANWEPVAGTTVTLEVTRAPQSIAFGPLAEKTFGDAPFAVSATATSGLPVSFTSSDGTVATVAGDGRGWTVTIHGAGTCTITASQAGDANWEAAAPVGQTLVVHRAVPVVTWPDPAPIVYGTALSSTQLNATAGTDGEFTYAPDLGAVLPAGTHTLSADFAPAEPANWEPVAGTTVTLEVTRSPQSIAFGPLAEKAFGDAPFAVTATATSGLPVSFSSSDDGVATVAEEGRGWTVTIHGAGTCTITASQAGDADWEAAAPVGQALVVHRAVPVVTWPDPAPVVYGTALSGAQLNATADADGEFSYDPDSGTVLAAGTHTLSADFAPAEPANWEPVAGTTVTLEVTRAPQSIAFSPLAEKTFGDAPFAVSATATSGLPVSFSSSDGTVATVVEEGRGWTVTIHGAGTCTITASQAGDANWEAAAPVGQALVVHRAVPVITWPDPAPIVYGTALSSTQLNAAADTDGEFTYAPDSGTVLGAGTHTLSADFAPAEPANWEPVAGTTVTLEVTRAPQSIAFSPIAEKTFGDAPFAVSATATSGLPVSFSSSDGTVATVAGDGRGWTVTIHGAGTCTITASQAGDADWEAAAPVGRTLVVQRAVPVVTWPDPAPIVYGTALSATQLNATADTDGEFSYAPDSGTVLAAGTHTLSADFAPAEPANWEPVAGTTVTLEVTRAPQSIAFDALPEKTFGDAPFAVSATATSGLPVSFSSSDDSVAAVAEDGRGWTVTIHGAGTCTITASQAGDANWEAAAPVGQTLVVHRAVPVVTWPDPAPIVYGTALSSTQLNAAADTDGEFTYDPDSGAVLGAGTHTLSADFAPAEPANWEPVAGTTVTLEVTRAPQSIAFSPLAEKTFGDAPFAVSATATSGLPVSFSSSDDGVATVAEDGRGWTVTIHGAGTCTITASQAGDANWEAAPPVGQTLVVQRAVPVVTWPDPAPIVYGTALSSTQLNAAADTDGEFTYDPDSGTVLAAGTHTLSADFAPAEPADWEPVAGTTVTLEVTRAPQSIAFSPLAEKTFGDAPFAVSATATSGLPVSFSSSDDSVATVAGEGRGWTVTIHGAGTCTITASQAGDADWQAAAPVGKTLVVQRAVPVVTWPDPAPVVYGTALSATQLNAAAGTDGEFSYDPDLGAVLPAGTHTLSADFAPAEPADWEPVAGTTVTLEVTRAPQSIAFSSLAEKTFGDAPFAVSATATSGLPVSFSSSDGTVATVAEDGRGWTVTIHGAGTCTITASQAGDADWEAAAPVGQTLVVHRAVPVVTWPDPAPIVYGTALSGAQLNAAADTDGEFTYDPDSGTVLGAGTHTLSADFAPAEPANWEPVAGTTVTLEVTRAPQSIAFDSLPEKTFGDAPFAVSATATSGLPVSFSSSDGTVATVAGDGRGWTVTIHGAGTCTITASQAGDANWEAAAPVGQALVVHRAVPVVTWPDPAPIVYGTALSATQLNAAADTDGEFTYDPDLGAVIGAGTHTLSADFAPAEPANWEPVAGTTVTLEVTRAPQSIAFSPIAEKTFGDPPFAVSATATSGLPVSFSSSDGTVATVAEEGHGWTVTIHGAGTCTITASQAGDANWESAAPVGQALVVRRAVPVVTWPDPAPIVYGTALSATQLNATAGTDGEFTYDPDLGAVLPAGTHTLSADFAPAEPANWEPVAGTTVTLEVTRAPQSIAFDALPEKTFGDAPFAVSATATSGLPVSFSSSDESVASVAEDGRGWTVTIHGAGTCTITASQAGDANWQAAVPVGRTLVVQRALPVVTWPDPAPIVYGTALSATQLNATADADGEFTYDPDLGAVLPAGTHTLSADFAPAEPANWELVTGVTVTLEVTKAPQTIVFDALAEKTFGDAPFAVSATATSGLPVSFSSSDDGVATVAGDGRGWTVTIHGAGTCTITASQAGDANWEAAAPVGQTLVVQRAVPVVTWPDPAPIVYGTALSSTQLNATADTDGEFTYDPDSGTVLAAGTHTLSADFAPAEPANWEPVAGTTVTLEVTRAPQSIAFSPLAGKTFGDAPFAVTATATSGLPVSFSSSDDGVATVAGDGRGWTVTIHGAGTCTITASQAGDANWEAAAPVGQALVVHRAVPVVTWPDPASIVYGTALSATQLNATADTDGEFTYDPDSGTVLGAGTHTLSADFAPAEPANWEPVAGTTVTLEVTRAPQSIAFSPLAEKTFGDAPFAVSATATSGLPVSFSSSDETVASLTGDRVSIHRAGSCVITATQAGNANWQPVETGTLLTVHRRMLDVTAENVVRREGKSNPEFTALYSGLATGDDPDLLTLGLVFVCSADQDSAPGEYPIDVSGVSHTVNYEVTYYAGTLTVTAKDIPVLTWPAPAAIVYGTALGDAQLNASADVPGRFGYEPAAGAVPGAGFHQLRVTFVPEDEVNWSSVSLSVPLTVTRATPTVDWSPPVDIVWGAALGDDQLNAESNVPGRFFYTPPAGTVLGVGVHTLSVDFLPDDSQNWQNVIGVGTTVTVVNTPPSVASDRHVELLEDVQEYALRIDAPSDADGHALAVTVVDLPNPAKLIVTYADGVTPVSLGSGLTPAAIPGLRVNTVVNATGAAGVFSYDVSDGAAMRSQTVTFEIAGVNDPPAFSFTELVLDDDGVRVEVSGWHDPDEGAVEAYEYEWFLDGLSVPSLSGSGVAFAELVEGVWECMVSAVDEFGAGTVMVTDALALCELRPGWNAVAVPVVPAGGMPLWLSPEGQARSAGAGPLWRWDVVRQRYARVTDVTAGGYWVYCGESAVRMLVKGDIARSAGDTAAVSGWHLVPGGRGGEQTDSDTLMAVFGFDALWAWDSWAGGYVVPPSVLKSVHAYWGYVRPDRER